MRPETNFLMMSVAVVRVQHVNIYTSCKVSARHAWTLNVSVQQGMLITSLKTEHVKGHSDFPWKLLRV